MSGVSLTHPMAKPSQAVGMTTPFVYGMSRRRKLNERLQDIQAVSETSRILLMAVFSPVEAMTIPY